MSREAPVRFREGLGVKFPRATRLVVFSDDKSHLARVRAEIGTFLERLRLVLHPDKSVVFPTRSGIGFLGYRVFPRHRLLARANVDRFRRRLRRMQADFARGAIPIDRVRTRIMSWIGHARQADIHRLRGHLFQAHPFSRATAV
jgi:RNA-directed DNA polymerase